MFSVCMQNGDVLYMSKTMPRHTHTHTHTHTHGDDVGIINISTYFNYIPAPINLKYKTSVISL